MRRLRELDPEATFARRVLRYRPLLFALVLLGPIGATLIVLLAVPGDPTDTLLTGEPIAGGIRLRLNITNVDVPRGEVAARLVGQPIGAWSDQGRLVRPVTITTNDIAGSTTIVYDANSPIPPTELRLPLEGGRITTFPFDHYVVDLLLIATSDQDVPTTLDIVSSVHELNLRLAEAPSNGFLPTATVARVDVARNGVDQAWVVFVMVLSWALALSCASIAWVTIVWDQEEPFWVWGFCVGVLFALPPLRAALPGSPPSGTIFDFAAFYWAVGIVAITLLVEIIVWNTRIRQAARASRATLAPDAPATMLLPQIRVEAPTTAVPVTAPRAAPANIPPESNEWAR